MPSHEKFVFSNTKSNQQMRNFLYAFLVIMAIEMVVAILIVRILTTSTSVFLAISSIIVFVDLFLVLYYIVPLLRSAHSLGENGLTIGLGRYFKTTVPWEMIERIEPVSIQVSTRDTLGLMLFRKEESFYCMATNQAAYMVSLKSPVLVKAKCEDNSKSKRGMITSIFINVDDKEAFDKTLKSYITNNDTKEVKPPESGLEEKALIFSPDNIRLSDTSTRSTGDPLLDLQNISYQYGVHKAVDNLSLTVRKGEIFALLGPNGAGKSTTLKMLTGLLKPKNGQILLNGHDIWAKHSEAMRKQIGYVPDQPILYFRLTAKEHLYYSGRLLGLEESVLMERINYLLELFDLVPYQEQMIETYSQGMQRKVSMCLALLNDPQLLIVDELTNAYDARTLAVIKKIFKERKAAGKTVLFSGHVMAVMEELADYIVIIQKGISYASGTMAELTAQYGNSTLEDLFLQLTDVHIND